MRAVVYEGARQAGVHEVEEAGPGVSLVWPGDRVVIPTGDEREDDFVLLADAFVTGWHATELAGIGAAPGPVAIFGAGAIGLLAAYSALPKGAGDVYVVDWIDARLAKAAELGATAVDFRAAVLRQGCLGWLRPHP